MCEPSHTKHLTPEGAAVALARFIEQELGITYGIIDNVALRLLIQAKWEKIAPLAHRIHDGK